MWFLFDEEKGQYITTVIKLKGGRYALYYRHEPVGCRWVSRRMAERRIDTLVLSGTLKLDHRVRAVWLEVSR